MFLLDADQQIVLSPSDLRTAAGCEFATLRGLDALLGRGPAVRAEDDAMLARTVALGEEHEQQVLRQLSAAHTVVGVSRPEPTREGLATAARQTLAALAPTADVVYQGAIFDGRFLGYADFIIREGDRWVVCDTKLAREATVAALLQVAAYAAALTQAGVPVAPSARLILGEGSVEDVPLAEIMPIYRARRARLEHLVDAHVAEPSPVAWGDPRWMACGVCPECTAELEATSDVLLVAGVHHAQRAKLRAAGVITMTDLAERSEPVPGVAQARLARWRHQARLQLAQEATGQVSAEVRAPEVLSMLPTPSAGDIFFDFEGDPLWTEAGSSDWGLEYLFGVVEAPGDDRRRTSHDNGGSGGSLGAPAYVSFVAHDRIQEKQALTAFLAYLTERRQVWPDLHVYHYAAYERSALLRLAVRHGVGEEEIDNLLRDGVFIDLYAVVRGALLVSQRSYSLKKLEPLYMGEHLRTGEVTTADASIVAYHEYTQAVIDGRSTEADRRLADILDYNRYDCLSTLRLRDWLLARAAETGVSLGHTVAELAEPQEPNAVESRLRALLPTSGPLDAQQRAVAMLAAAVQFNRREHKPYWWAHFDRLRGPVDEWAGTSEVFHIEAGRVLRDWSKEGKQRSLRRLVQLEGGFASGSRVVAGTRVHAIYDTPLPAGMEPLPSHLRVARGVSVRSRERIDAGNEALVVEETLPRGVEPYAELPIALGPDSPPATTSIDAALESLGRDVIDRADPAQTNLLWPQPGLDLLQRLPPRLRSGTSLPSVVPGDTGFVDAVTAAVLDLDRSYLGVQGPPGTGKTYVGARVIARLVNEHRWKVGVVAQSHAAVENLLHEVVSGAGLAPSQVAKSPGPSSTGTPSWTAIGKNDVAAWTTARVVEGTGYVLGGTAWDFTAPARVPPSSLDLVVVDEAGQYSLATTLAISLAGASLLLLGDPQQLPQVSQGTHPEPVNGSALGWLLGDEPVIPPRFGYFLATSWRMHPAIARAVSALSYAGELGSHESITAARSLDGIDPGVHVVQVDHLDNATESAEEAAAVTELVAGLLGRTWRDPGADPPERALEQCDILVLTPYNAQVTRIEAALEAAGFGQVAVGSVDRFQGQEAPVVILSMAASTVADVPRGVGFLLSRNRLNVSISRGQYAAFIVRSRVLTDAVPRTTQELLALGAFMSLCGDTTTTT
ncbi:MAG: TM0106 family RecB-like putative nuclease [Nostocoides sp.]